MARVLVRDATTELSTDIDTVQGNVNVVTIPGEVKAYAGAAAPTGFLFCHGQAVSRTTYSALYAILGTSHGSGDGSTTFNLPDYRGSFLRGLVNVTTVTGTGTVSSGAATFTAHGFNRTGFKVRLSSGTLSPLAVSTDYYVSVIDANTLKFSTTRANALAGTFIAITGANSAVLTQWEDPDYSSRERITSGANATGLGAVQEDTFKAHTHTPTRQGQRVGAVGTDVCVENTFNNYAANHGTTGGNETRSKNVLINYIIKY